MAKNQYLSFRVNLLFTFFLILGSAFFTFLVFCVLSGKAFPTILFVAGALILLSTILVFLYYYIPLRKMERNLNLFLDGFTMDNTDEFRNLQYSEQSAELLKRYLTTIDSKELLKLNKRQAQYLALQNQINPHFLYNTLESIRSEALSAGLDSVADMTEALATFFRYTISKVENLVTVEEELQNCETYFRIQRYRFGERLELSVECEEKDRDFINLCKIPKLTLQPILENSIIHGTECKIGTGHIRIMLTRSSTHLIIHVVDDGVGMDQDMLFKLNGNLSRSGTGYVSSDRHEEGGIALVNVNNRIHLLFGEEYGLHIYSAPGVGTDVEISLPIIKSDRELHRSGQVES